MTEKLSLLADLWASNFSSELSHHPETNLANEAHAALQNGYLFIIILKMRPDVKIKVKNLITKTEVEVSRYDILSFLNTEMTELGKLGESFSGSNRHRRFETSGGLDSNVVMTPAKESKLEIFHVDSHGSASQKKGKSRNKDRLQVMDRGYF